MTVFQRHPDKGISCENLSGFYTPKDLIIQIFRATMGAQFTLYAAILTSI